MLTTFTKYWSLILALTQREIEARYKGSFGGTAWYVIQTLISVCVYSLVFGTIFKSRWAETGQPPINFAMALFIGLLVFNLFSESVGRASTLIITNANYVKKLVFPLEILPVVTLMTALFNFVIGLVVFLAVCLVLQIDVAGTSLWLPVILAPFVIMVLGLMWFLASFGTFVRDTPQIVSLLTMIMMFLSPLFYPASTLPEELRSLIQFNPIAFPMEQSRKALLFGQAPDLAGLAVFTAIAALVGAFGYLWFQKTRKAFSDVL
jgi:ABC-type polysaccharide/polyol phosphate export systems, permease component